MTPPDSGEREVCVVCSLPATRGDDESGRKYWCGKHGPFYDYVTIRKDLAQRILAALHAFESLPNEFAGKEWRLLATELWERLPR